MVEQLRTRLACLKVEDVLRRYPGLRLAPSQDGSLTLTGGLDFRVQGPSHDIIEDSYAIKLSVPATFPSQLPDAWETGGRIPPGYHKLNDGSLCLGAPIDQRMTLTLAPTLLVFVEKLLIPYLYGFSFFTRYAKMPYGELAHGNEGIRQSIASLFGCRCSSGVKEFLRLASLRKRHANKLPCPCASGRRLGRCHHRKVNALRNLLGRAWFRQEYARIVDDKNQESKSPSKTPPTSLRARLTAHHFPTIFLTDHAKRRPPTPNHA